MLAVERSRNAQVCGAARGIWRDQPIKDHDLVDCLGLGEVYPPPWARFSAR